MTLILSTKQKQTACAIYAELSKLGWKHVDCCGLLAMAVGEASLNPAAKGDESHGVYHSFGLWQIQDVAAVLKGTGVDLAHDASAVDQCKAVDYLLKHSEHKAGDALKMCLTAHDAAAVLVNLFERPANKPAAVAKRVPYAIYFDAMFKAVA